MLNIALNETKKYLRIGESFTLEATIETVRDPEEYTISWDNSNPDVLSLTEEGVITALNSGFSTITVSAGEKEAFCIVFVSGTDEILLTQSTLKLELDPYSRGLSNAFLLNLATDNVDINTISGDGICFLIEFYADKAITNYLPTGLYDVVTDFVLGEESEYDKFIPNTIAPGFTIGGNKWGTWYQSIAGNNVESVEIIKGKVDIDKSEDFYIIAYDLYDKNENQYTGIYQGEVILSDIFNSPLKRFH